MSSSNSPCAACKFLRRKCTQECVFAPYFPPDQPQKFANVHKVFGASNVAKLLNDIPTPNREDAVNSLAYEAEARLRDPVYGCVGLISILQHKLKQLQNDLISAKQELSTYIGPSAMLPMLPYNPGYMAQQYPGNPSSSGVMPYNMPRMMGLSAGAGPSHGGASLVIRDPQQQQLQQQHTIDAQQMAAAVSVREQQELMRSYEQQMQIRQQLHQHHHPNQEFAAVGGFQGGFDPDGAPPPFITSAVVAPTVLGCFDDNPYEIQQQQQQENLPHHQQENLHHHQLQTQHLLQSEQLQLQQPQQQQQQQRSGSDEGRSVGPSS